MLCILYRYMTTTTENDDESSNGIDNDNDNASAQQSDRAIVDVYVVAVLPMVLYMQKPHWYGLVASHSSFSGRQYRYIRFDRLSYQRHSLYFVRTQIPGNHQMLRLKCSFFSFKHKNCWMFFLMHRCHQYIDVCFIFCKNNPAKMERNRTSSFEDVENKLYRHRKQQQLDTVKYFGRAFFVVVPTHLEWIWNLTTEKSFNHTNTFYLIIICTFMMTKYWLVLGDTYRCHCTLVLFPFSIFLRVSAVKIS